MNVILELHKLISEFSYYFPILAPYGYGGMLAFVELVRNDVWNGAKDRHEFN